MKVTSTIAFRLDDITPDMDWNRFYRIKGIFDKYNIKPLLGVVPDNRDEGLSKGLAREDFWELMRSLKAKGWEIAMHGTYHRYETTSSGMLGLKNASEFAGLSYKQQLDKVNTGLAILREKGITTDIFMAPGHTYDKRTLKALKRAGFLCVSDGYSDVPYRYKGLLFVPSRNSKPVLSKGMDTICIHCNDLGDRDFLELDGFLSANRSHVVDFSEVTGQLWYPKRTIFSDHGERVNLIKARAKRSVGRNEGFARYLRDTFDESPKRKLINRVINLPKLIFSKRYR